MPDPDSRPDVPLARAPSGDDRRLGIEGDEHRMLFVLGWNSATRHRRSIVAFIAGKSLPNEPRPEPALDRYRGSVAFSSIILWRKLRVWPR